MINVVLILLMVFFFVTGFVIGLFMATRNDNFWCDCEDWEEYIG